jgi:hypothetical protein
MGKKSVIPSNITLVGNNNLTESDTACQAIFDIITEFKLKVDEYEETKNEDLRAEPALSTDKATQEVIGMFTSIFYWITLAQTL